MQQNLYKKFDSLDAKYQEGVVYIKLMYDILILVDLNESVVASL